MTTPETTAQNQPPKDSYRALLHLRANGVDVSEFDLRIYRQEEELIRSFFYYPQQLRECGLEPAHFIAPVHALAWQAMLALLRQPQHAGMDEFDPTLVLSQMRELDEERLGGPRGHTWLLALLSEPPINPGDVLQKHVKDVRAMHRNRRWARRYADLAERVKTDPDIAGVQTDYVRAGMQVAFQVDGENIVSDPIDAEPWDARTKEVGSLVRTGIDAIDHASGGGHGRGDMMVVGGGTGHGKSFFAAKLLRAQARLKQKALYISLEDPEELMKCRLLAGYCEPSVEAKDIRNRTADPDVVELADKRHREEFDGHIWVERRPKATIGQVCDLIRTYRYTREIGLVIIDYLQAGCADEPMHNKVQEMSMFTSALKRCFVECSVAGVVLSQYNRESYKDGAEPGLNSCKYCGDIENEAEVMVLLWRDIEKRLNVKLAKVKWASAADLRYLIAVDRVSGWHGRWEENYDEEPDDDAA